ncbi:MAG: type I-MYXAN CRISPR-associated protein Cas6/Cmx6 [Gammaproteobacteria bacterium]|nr:type I-MYXAN CRISPR-associated protein Cas6/Cmx6 [Gammaproteobacteria bacterium]
MYWHEEDETRTEYQVPDDVFDLVFKLRGNKLDIDHAFALSEALLSQLSGETCKKIGVHGVRMARSGNGWNRPQQIDATLPLSRRARLVIRVRREDGDEVTRISHKKLQIGEHEIEVGESVMRKLSTIGTLHARAVCCTRDQSESDFLGEVAARLQSMNIGVSKMICGKSAEIRLGDDTLFTRALLVADLQPEESVTLQQQGLGEGRLLGCGLFIPHKGIDPVFSPQQQIC